MGLDYITATSSIAVCFHDATLPEMNMLGSYLEYEGANLHTIVDTSHFNDKIVQQFVKICL